MLVCTAVFLLQCNTDRTICPLADTNGAPIFTGITRLLMTEAWIGKGADPRSIDPPPLKDKRDV
jgi:hypothetical protein